MTTVRFASTSMPSATSRCCPSPRFAARRGGRSIWGRIFMKRLRADIISARAFRQALLVTVAGPVCLSVGDGVSRAALAADRDGPLDFTVTAQAPAPPPPPVGAADQPAEEITI